MLTKSVRALASLFMMVSLAICSTGALAQNEFDLSSLASGQILLNLSINEETEVDQDQLTSVLQFTTRGRDQVALQNEVNEAMTAALALLEESEDLDYSTQQYHVYPIEPPGATRRDAETPVWQAQQSIRISSSNSTELLEITGELQAAGLHLTSLSYSLSPEKYQEISDSMLDSALQNLQRRADEAASALNKGSAELIEISLNHSQNIPYRREAMMAMASDMAMTTPVAEPGKSTVSLNISARALLSP